MSQPSLAYSLMLTGLLIACSPVSVASKVESHSDRISYGGRPAILARGEGEQRLMLGRRPVDILVDSATVGSPTLVAGISDILPGDSIPVHKHLGEEEILFIQRGILDVTLGDQARRVGSGGTVFIPRGTWVGARAVGPDTATVFFVFNASAYEKCLRAQSSRLGERYVPPSAEALQTIRRECHQVRKSE